MGEVLAHAALVGEHPVDWGRDVGHAAFVLEARKDTRHQVQCSFQHRAPRRERRLGECFGLGRHGERAFEHVLAGVQALRVRLFDQISRNIFPGWGVGRGGGGQGMDFDLAGRRDRKLAMGLFDRQISRGIAEKIHVVLGQGRCRLDDQGVMACDLMGAGAWRQMKKVLRQRHIEGVGDRRLMADVVDHGLTLMEPCRPRTCCASAARG